MCEEWVRPPSFPRNHTSPGRDDGEDGDDGGDKDGTETESDRPPTMHRTGPRASSEPVISASPADKEVGPGHSQFTPGDTEAQEVQ